MVDVVKDMIDMILDLTYFYNTKIIIYKNKT